MSSRSSAIKRGGTICLLSALLLTSCEIRKRGEEVELPPPENIPMDISQMAEEISELPPPDANDDRTLEQRLNDASLAAQVKLALAEESALRSYNFEPEVRSGVALLRGDVASAREYSMAEQVARRVAGVRGVQNEIVAPDLETTADAADSATTGSPSGPVQVPALTEQTKTPSAPLAPASESAQAYHTVGSGESLWEIARKNGTTIEALRRLNNLQGDRIGLVSVSGSSRGQSPIGEAN